MPQYTLWHVFSGKTDADWVISNARSGKGMIPYYHIPCDGTLTLCRKEKLDCFASSAFVRKYPVRIWAIKAAIMKKPHLRRHEQRSENANNTN